MAEVNETEPAKHHRRHWERAGRRSRTARECSAAGNQQRRPYVGDVLPSCGTCRIRDTYHSLRHHCAADYLADKEGRPPIHR